LALCNQCPHSPLAFAGLWRWCWRDALELLLRLAGNTCVARALAWRALGALISLQICALAGHCCVSHEYSASGEARKHFHLLFVRSSFPFSAWRALLRGARLVR
jgi:hypothetical protein